MKAFNHCDTDDSVISLHDCRAEKMSFCDGIVSFSFPDGFWITKQHPENKLDEIVRTFASQVDFSIIDEEIEGVSIYIFKKNLRGKVIREEWELDNFIKAVNGGDFQIEFITQYKSFQSVLFKCWVWFDKKPYHMECEITLHTDSVVYKWNQMNKDRVW